MASQAVLDLVVNLRDNATGGLGRIGSAAGKLGLVMGGAAIAGGAAAIGAIGGGLAFAAGEAREAAQTMAQLDAVLASTGGRAGVTRDEITELASSLSDAAGASLFNDEALVAAQTTLLQYGNITEDVFGRVTKLSADVATRMGGDPVDAARKLGKALNDPAQALNSLARMGIEFTEAQQDQVKAMVEAGDIAGAQAFLLGELEKSYGGAAQAAADATGPFTQFRAQLGEIAEDVGTRLLPLWDRLGGVLTNPAVVGAIQSFADTAVGGILRLADWLEGTAFPRLSGVVGMLGELFRRIVNKEDLDSLVGDIVGTLTGGFGPGSPAERVATVLTNVASMIQTGLQLARDSVTTFQAALAGEWVRDDSILGIHQIVGAIGTFIGKAREFIDTHGPEIRAAVQGAAAAFATFTILNTVAGWITAAVAAWGALSGAVTAAGGVIGTIVALLGGPLTIAIGAIAVAVGLFAYAWSTDWNGIQGKLATVWATIKPFLDEMRNTFTVVLPQALFLLRHAWDTVWGAMTGAFDGIARGIERVAGWIDTLGQKLRGLSIPDWLTPGSPTPLETGLYGIAGAMREVSRWTGFLDGIAAPSIGTAVAATILDVVPAVKGAIAESLAAAFDAVSHGDFAMGAVVAAAVGATSSIMTAAFEAVSHGNFDMSAVVAAAVGGSGGGTYSGNWPSLPMGPPGSGAPALPPWAGGQGTPFGPLPGMEQKVVNVNFYGPTDEGGARRGVTSALRAAGLA